MNKERRLIIWVLLAAVICIAAFFGYYRLSSGTESGRDHVDVGFILIGDESTSYSANFIKAIDELELQYGGRISINVMSNVTGEDADRAIRELCDMGCDIVFTNSFDYQFAAKPIAAEYPDVEFCQATGDNANTEPVLSNYHTFMGEIYQGRYVSGLVAGLKLQEMIDEGIITEDEAWIGHVGAYPYAEVISGYTSFLLGVRQTCPSARMRVKYVNSWTNYALEKSAAEELIEEGCVVIFQATDTIGPVVACENADAGRPVYNIGYNLDVIDIAPTTALTGCRIDWAPYIIGAVGAVLEDRRIEDSIPGNVHGNDIGAGFGEGWVKMLQLNPAIAPAGAAELIQQAISDFGAGKCHVFKGDYLGVNPFDPEDVWDLNTEFPENAEASAPAFNYVLKGIIVVE